MPQVLCPVCRLPLARQPSLWSCGQGHSFDVAREGYVNLLLAQHKNSPEPGDNPGMVSARREFLDAGHYRPLRDAVLEMLAPQRAQTLLDVGCGEGYYTAALTAVAQEVIGLDIAKPAIRLAARRMRELTWLVASGASLPFADGAIDVVSNLFTQLHVQEMHRVLSPTGQVLVATPAPDHLWSLRAGLFEEVRAHEPDKFLADFAPRFELVDRREVRCALDLTQAALRQLLEMTPYVWKARPEKRAALEANERFSTTAAFTLLLFRKIAAPTAIAR